MGLMYRLLDLALGDAILVSLAILCLGSGGQLRCGRFGEEPCVTVIRSLQKLPGAVYDCLLSYIYAQRVLNK